ncbi:MAG: sulfatase-like hydrolase/transferase [Kiritimatiellae bacterium]|nr:sulfatase-like hydrolase/transferase [Kiritimatiellia bacterium]
MPKKDKPNILYILADDMGWGDVSFHGSPIRTPTLDRLAATGVELDHHYVCPVCTPTRTALLTGRHPARFGKHATTPTIYPVLPDGYETLATSLRNAGYDTALFGKWHLGSSLDYAANRWGFNISYGLQAGCMDPYTHRYWRPGYEHTWHRDGKPVDEPGHATDLIGAAAYEWIRTRKGPWFCYVPFTAVHEPVKAPQCWLDKYEGRTYDDDPLRDRSFKKYAAYASHMDGAIGRLIELLEEMHLTEETLIIFTSDNGAIEGCDSAKKWPGFYEATPRLGSNLPLRGRKAQLYEGGIRTPTLVNWAGTLSPRKVEEPMHVVDWMPTLTRLVGCKPGTDARWDGIDIWPLLSGEGGAAARRGIYWNLRHQYFGMVHENWKLILDRRKKETTELFDILADPYEKQDLAAEKPDVVAKLTELIAQEREQDGTSKRPDVDEEAQ